MKMARHLLIGFCVLVVLAVWASSATAFVNYGATGQNCKACHLIFSGGTGNATHNVHAAAVGNNCGVCHGGFPPALENCVQCHRQAGLVAHHENANTGAGCGGCHPGLTPLPENTVPIGYTTVATIPLDSCDGSEERFDSFTVSLDNDGDLLYDGDDPDCAGAVCGNGTIEAGEDCDDGNTMDGDCCSADCLFEANGSPCPDGVFCNGDETCDGAGACLAGPIPACSDGVDCTVDTCDTGTDACINTPNDANCPDDGAFCTGDEFCDAELDCTSTGDPCDVGTTCNEDTDTCDAAQDCGNGTLETGEDCDDGNTMDGDCCSANCTFETAGSSCDDGQFCNGEDTCDGAGSCDLGTEVDCNDNVECTADSCDEAADACVNTPDNGACDDGLFCNGVETCDAVNDCQAGTPPDCSDGVDCTDDLCDTAPDACINTPNDANCADDGQFCNGGEFCDAVSDCSSTGDPCPAGTVCDEETDMCDAAVGCGDGQVDEGEDCDDGNTMDGDCCSADCRFESDGSACSDGEFCNGVETCDGAGTCQDGTPVSCDDGIDCTSDACDEVGDSCMNTANDNLCASDGLYCTGRELCDPAVGCVSEGDPCPEGTTCNEETDTCDTGDLCSGVVCDPTGDPCAVNLCDPADGICKVQNVADGTQCDDQNPCTDGDMCSGGICGGISLLGEEGPFGDPTCSDGCDNDEDGFTDGDDDACMTADACDRVRMEVEETCLSGDCRKNHGMVMRCTVKIVHHAVKDGMIDKSCAHDIIREVAQSRSGKKCKDDRDKDDDKSEDDDSKDDESHDDDSHDD